MEEGEYMFLLDAKLYLCVLNLIISGQDFGVIYSQIRKVRSVINGHPELTYCTSGNILSLLLLYTTPNSISIKNIRFLAEKIQGVDQEDEYEVDLEEFTNMMVKESNLEIMNDIAIKSTAEGVLIDSKISGNKLGFSGEDDVVGDALQFLFIKAKTLQLSRFSNDLKMFYPLFSGLQDYQPFKEWFNGLIIPFVFYWDNFAALMDKYSTFDEFVRQSSLEEQFETLIEPLEIESQGFKLSVEIWISNVILPLITHHNNNFTPLLKWLFNFGSTTTNKKYDRWSHCFKSIYSDTSMRFDSYELLVKYFLGACYYYTIFYDNIDNLNSIEIMKIYSEIKSTLDIISNNIAISKELPVVQLKSIDEYENLEMFINEKQNPLSSLFEPNSGSIEFLRNIIETCEKLHPINKLTVVDYLRFKYIENSKAKKLEVSKILSNLDQNNWGQLLSSSNIFIKTFTPKEKETGESINKLIIERFLIFDLFDVVIDLIDSKEIQLDTNDLYNITEFKFWNSFNQATNLNENMGKFRECNLCVKLFDKISLNNDLSEVHRGKIIEIKHLLKALSNMKNFKLVIEKNTPCTPKQVLNKVGSFSMDPVEQLDNSSTPLNLIALILEQNPKSYIAFEKLYKILNDLLLFSNSQTLKENSPNIYFDKLKSLCIESALVDNNFTFAYKKSKELFEHYANSDQNKLSSLWLTFYQVGKYVSPTWFDETPDASIDKLDVLLKQREILTLTLGLPLDSSTDNSRILLNQWASANSQIQEFFKNSTESNQVQTQQVSSSAKFENTPILSNIISDATNSTNQASEKLSNLFVSGLGWAIGANP